MCLDMAKCRSTRKNASPCLNTVPQLMCSKIYSNLPLMLAGSLNSTWIIGSIRHQDGNWPSVFVIAFATAARISETAACEVASRSGNRKWPVPTESDCALGSNWSGRPVSNRRTTICTPITGDRSNGPPTSKMAKHDWRTVSRIRAWDPVTFSSEPPDSTEPKKPRWNLIYDFGRWN